MVIGLKTKGKQLGLNPSTKLQTKNTQFTFQSRSSKKEVALCGLFCSKLYWLVQHEGTGLKFSVKSSTKQIGC